MKKRLSRLVGVALTAALLLNMAVLTNVFAEGETPVSDSEVVYFDNTGTWTGATPVDGVITLDNSAGSAVMTVSPVLPNTISATGLLAVEFWVKTPGVNDYKNEDAVLKFNWSSGNASIVAMNLNSNKTRGDSAGIVGTNIALTNTAVTSSGKNYFPTDSVVRRMEPEQWYKVKFMLEQVASTQQLDSLKFYYRGPGMQNEVLQATSRHSAATYGNNQLSFTIPKGKNLSVKDFKVYKPDENVIDKVIDFENYPLSLNVFNKYYNLGSSVGNNQRIPATRTYVCSAPTSTLDSARANSSFTGTGARKISANSRFGFSTRVSPIINKNGFYDIYYNNIRNVSSSDSINFTSTFYDGKKLHNLKSFNTMQVAAENGIPTVFGKDLLDIDYSTIESKGYALNQINWVYLGTVYMDSLSPLALEISAKNNSDTVLSPYFDSARFIYSDNQNQEVNNDTVTVEVKKPYPENTTLNYFSNDGTDTELKSAYNARFIKSNEEPTFTTSGSVNWGADTDMTPQIYSFENQTQFIILGHLSLKLKNADNIDNRGVMTFSPELAADNYYRVLFPNVNVIQDNFSTGLNKYINYNLVDSKTYPLNAYVEISHADGITKIPLYSVIEKTMMDLGVYKFTGTDSDYVKVVAGSVKPAYLPETETCEVVVNGVSFEKQPTADSGADILSVMVNDTALASDNGVYSMTLDAPVLNVKVVAKNPAAAVTVGGQALVNGAAEITYNGVNSLPITVDGAPAGSISIAEALTLGRPKVSFKAVGEESFSDMEAAVFAENGTIKFDIPVANCTANAVSPAAVLMQKTVGVSGTDKFNMQKLDLDPNSAGTISFTLDIAAGTGNELLLAMWNNLTDITPVTKIYKIGTYMNEVGAFMGIN